MIQTVVGGVVTSAYNSLAGALKSGTIKISTAGNIPHPANAPIDTVAKFQLLTSKKFGKWARKDFAPNQAKVVNDAIAKQLANIQDDVVEELLELSAKDKVGFIEMQAIKSRKVKTISLGTARAYTKRSGKEIALVYDTVRKQNVLFFGDAKAVTWKNVDKLLLKGAADGKSLRFIWHTHPSVTASKDFILHAERSFASTGDPAALLWFGNSKSFVIPPDVRGLDFIRIFTQ